MVCVYVCVWGGYWENTLQWSYVLSSSLEAYEVYLSILLTYTNSESVNLCGKILRNLKEMNKNRIKKRKNPVDINM